MVVATIGSWLGGDGGLVRVRGHVGVAGAGAGTGGSGNGSGVFGARWQGAIEEDLEQWSRGEGQPVVLSLPTRRTMSGAVVTKVGACALKSGDGNLVGLGVF